MRNSLRIRKQKWPQHYKPVSPELEKQHSNLWSPLYSPIELGYLRFCCNYSGLFDYRYVPQDIYSMIIMRIMNRIDRSQKDKDKNYLDRIIKPGLTPKIFLRNICGSYVDESFTVVPRVQAKTILSEIDKNIIVKPSLASSRGQNVRLFRFIHNCLLDDQDSTIQLDDLEKLYKKDFVVQEQVIQHPFLAELNASTVNSFRISTYRSVITEEVHILSSFLKIGKQGALVDNLHGGGINCRVDTSGYLSNFAVDLEMNKIFKIPGSDKSLSGLQIPHFNKVLALSKHAGKCMPAHRLLHLDIALTGENKPCLLEINLVNSGLSQIHGNPHFGSFTEEIVEFCKRNRHRDDFKVFRS